MQAIEDLPDQDSPELFGLHANVNLTVRRLQVQAAIQVIMETQPRSVSVGGNNNVEDMVNQLCEELLLKASICTLSV
jgi:dynein heavy chain